MKISKITLLLILFLSTLNFTSCKKRKKGVLEMRTYSVLVSSNQSGNSSVTTIFNDNYKCFVTDESGLQDGQKVSYYVNGSDYGGAGATNVEYMYHSKESPKSLGYKNNISENGPYNTHYGSLKDAFNVKDGGGRPGEKSGFSRIGGKWKHAPTGLIIWIDNDESGRALCVEGGSSAPPEAVGGYAWREINHSGGNKYTFINQTYYPVQGWVDASQMNLIIDEDGESFDVNGQTYDRM